MFESAVPPRGCASYPMLWIASTMAGTSTRLGSYSTRPECASSEIDALFTPRSARSEPSTCDARQESRRATVGVGRRTATVGARVTGERPPMQRRARAGSLH
eukprot:6193634-Pleurochrysis_carterae.AAC.11